MRREIWHGRWVVTHATLKTIHGANEDEDFPGGTIADWLLYPTMNGSVRLNTRTHIVLTNDLRPWIYRDDKKTRFKGSQFINPLNITKSDIRTESQSRVKSVKTATLRSAHCRL